MVAPMTALARLARLLIRLVRPIAAAMKNAPREFLRHFREINDAAKWPPERKPKP